MSEISPNENLLDKKFKELYQLKKKFISKAFIDHMIVVGGISKDVFDHYRYGRTEPPRSFKILFLSVLDMYHPAKLYKDDELQAA